MDISELKGHARVDVADVLRGLAVMGIIILHSIEHFNFYSFPPNMKNNPFQMALSEKFSHALCPAVSDKLMPIV